MGNRSGFYKSDKRKKEVARQKKQEEKKLRQQKKPETADQETPVSGAEAPASDEGADGKDPNVL